MRKRSRITITLEPDVLKRVDSLVDGIKVKNRSQAIEDLVIDGLGASVDTAVIMAGGTRIRDLSCVLKKVNGEYLMAHMIKHLKKYHINRLIVCSGDLIGDIKKAFGNGSQYGVTIKYVQETKPLGTMGALKKAEKIIDRDNFLVLYGDILTNMNLDRFIEFHFAEQRPITVGVKPRMGEQMYGQVFMQGNSIIDYSDKETNVGLSLVNTGVYLLNSTIFKHIKPGVKQSMGKHMMPKLVKKDMVSGYIFQGIWFDISKEENFEEACNRWK